MNRNKVARWAVALLAIAALSGCVVYPYGYGRHRYYAEGGYHPQPVPR